MNNDYILIFPYARKLRNEKVNPKNFPFWKELIKLLNNNLIIQAGIEGEEQLVPNFYKNKSLNEVKDLIKNCKFWISVDSAGPHIAHHISKPGVVIWSISDPLIFGYPENLNILKDRKYLRKSQFELWEQAEHSTEPFLSAQEVFEIISKHFNLQSP